MFLAVLFRHLVDLAPIPLLMTLSGCLVTDVIELPDEEQCPPSIETPSNARYPLNQIVSLQLDLLPAGAGTGLEFVVDVRDCNEEQALQLKAVLDFRPAVDPDPPIISRFLINPLEREGFTFQVPLEDLNEAGRCQKLEVYVSSQFQFEEELSPVESGDLGTAAWFIEVTDEDNPVVETNTCP